MEELNEFTYSMIKRMQDSEQKYKNHLDVCEKSEKGRLNFFIIFFK